MYASQTASYTYSNKTHLILLETQYALLRLALRALFETVLASEPRTTLALLFYEHFNYVIIKFSNLGFFLFYHLLFLLAQFLVLLIVLFINHLYWFLTSEANQDTLFVSQLIQLLISSSLTCLHYLPSLVVD